MTTIIISRFNDVVYNHFYTIIIIIIIIIIGPIVSSFLYRQILIDRIHIFNPDGRTLSSPYIYYKYIESQNH